MKKGLVHWADVQYFCLACRKHRLLVCSFMETILGFRGNKSTSSEIVFLILLQNSQISFYAKKNAVYLVYKAVKLYVHIILASSSSSH